MRGIVWTVSFDSSTELLAAWFSGIHGLFSAVTFREFTTWLSELLEWRPVSYIVVACSECEDCFYIWLIGNYGYPPSRTPRENTAEPFPTAASILFALVGFDHA
jgi:hypothetical protein